MELAFNIAHLVITAGSVLVAVVLWLTRSKQSSATADAKHAARLDAQGREIGDLKKRVDAMIDSHELVIRLDERLQALERTLKDQPQMIALCVGEALKAAWKFNPARA